MKQIGEYIVLGVLGQGGMSTVYEGEERLSHRRVALKVMQPAMATSPRVRELFVREMAILGRIDHPNVVRLHASMEIDGELVMVLELVQGETLRDALQRHGRFAWPDAGRVLRQVLAGLWAAHGQSPPVVHRDLKPENVMIASDGTIKVMDFGIAKVIRDDTLATTDVGTLQYMCPEQIEGVRIDARADLYNCGLILYEMLTGAPPFRSHSTRELLNAQCLQSPPPLPRELSQALPAGLEALMLQLLAKTPDDRPPTAQAVLHRLDGVANPGPWPLASVASTPASGDAAVARWSADAQWASTVPQSAQPWVNAPTQAGTGYPTGHAGYATSQDASRRGPRASLGVVLAVFAALLGVFTVVGWLVSRTQIEKPAVPSSPATVSSKAGADTEGARIAAVACSVETDAKATQDLVVLLDTSSPKMAWLDGSTGKTRRTRDLDTEVIYCITPRVLGLVHSDDTKLDMIDARSEKLLETATAELGVYALQRNGDKLVLVESDSSSRELPIPGCDREGCAFPYENVPYGKVFRDPQTPGFGAAVSVPPMCTTELDVGGIHYAVDETPGWAVVTAKRDEARIWAKRIPIADSGFLMRCALAADEHVVAVLRSESQDGDLTMVQLDPDDGRVLAESSVGEAGRTLLAVSAFFSNGTVLFAHLSHHKQLLAFDPKKGEIAWRR